MKPCQTKKQPVQRGSGSKKFKRRLIPTYSCWKLKFLILRILIELWNAYKQFSSTRMRGGSWREGGRGEVDRQPNYSPIITI